MNVSVFTDRSDIGYGYPQPLCVALHNTYSLLSSSPPILPSALLANGLPIVFYRRKIWGYLSPLLSILCVCCRSTYSAGGCILVRVGFSLIVPNLTLVPFWSERSCVATIHCNDTSVPFAQSAFTTVDRIHLG